jgi:hypothetical protein
MTHLAAESPKKTINTDTIRGAIIMLQSRAPLPGPVPLFGILRFLATIKKIVHAELGRNCYDTDLMN